MSTDKRHMDDVLLTRFLTEEVSDSERRRVIEWLAADEANQAYFDKIEQIWLESAKLNPKPIAVNTDAAWEKLQARLDNDAKKDKPLSRTPILRIKMLGRIAALILALAALYFIFTYKPAPETVIFANHSTENITDTLVDGSLITLSADAQITYLDNFNQKDRKVALQGKAFFDIARDTTKTFTIEAGIGGVQVLGTSFSVDMEKDSDIVVDVVSGIVRLFLPQENKDTLTLVLTAGESGIISNQNKTITKIEATPEVLYWLDKSIVFQNTKMDKVLQALTEIYHVSFVHDDDRITSDSLSTRFENASLEEVMYVVSLTLGIEYSIENNKVYLSKPVDEK